jgi:thymidine phosphorylase
MGTSREPRLHEVTVALGAELLRLVGIADSDEAARARIDDALASGAAAERFDRMNVALGGPSDLLTNLDAHLPLGPIERPVLPARDGTLARMDVRRIGLAVMELGGGRRHADDVIDYGVGFSSMCRLGDAVGPTKPVCTVHARSKADAEAGIQAVLAAIDVQDGPLETRSAIAKRVAPRPPLKTT